MSHNSCKSLIFMAWYTVVPRVEASNFVCLRCFPTEGEGWELLFECDSGVHEEEELDYCRICFAQIVRGRQGVLATEDLKPIPIVEYDGRMFFRRSDGRPGAPLRDDGLVDWDYMLDRPCQVVHAPAETPVDSAVSVGVETDYSSLILPAEEMWD